MRKINNLLIQKEQLVTKILDLQLQVKGIEDRVSLLQSHLPDSQKSEGKEPETTS